MKNRMFASVAISTVFMLLTFKVYAIPSLSFNPSDSVASVGDSIVVDLMVSLEGNEFLGDYDINFSYDASIVQLVDVAIGAELDVFGFGANLLDVIVDNAAGSANIAEISFDSPFDLQDSQLAVFSLATLTFDAVAVGLSGLDFGEILLGDEFGIGFLDVNATDGSICVDCVPVEAVPEPGALLLLCLGLAGLTLRRRQ